MDKDKKQAAQPAPQSPGKKAHKPRDVDTAQMPTGHGRAGQKHKNVGQTAGEFSRDPKRRTGQFSAAGDPPLMKK
jgi:hypothetical protein